MVDKISGLARALYILLAIVAGFVAIGTLDTALALVVLGLIAGISAPRERLVLGLAAVIALPIIGTALGLIPAIGAQLTAIAGNLQLGIAGAVATGLAMLLYELAMDGLMGVVGNGATGRAKAARV